MELKANWYNDFWGRHILPTGFVIPKLREKSNNKKKVKFLFEVFKFS